MRKVVIYIISMVLLMGALAGCAPENQTVGAGANQKVSIVCTIFPPYDFARAIAGDKADVHMLVDPGTEIHSYDPSPADMVTMQNADVFIYIGGKNDTWVKTVLESMETDKKAVIRLMDAVTPVSEEVVEGMEAHHHHDADDDSHASEHEEYDEHIWTSPKNAERMVKAIADAVCEVDPDNAQAYRDNAAAYTAKIQDVDMKIRQIVDNAARHTLVVGDRFPFRYMTEEYGLEYRAAFLGCSADTEVSANTLAYLIDLVKQEGYPYIYHIEFSNKAIASAICEQTGAQMLELHSCHNVSKQDFEAGVTYVDIMTRNAENLKKGLG